MGTREAVWRGVRSAAVAAAFLLPAGCGGESREEGSSAAAAGSGEGAPAAREGLSAPLAPVPAHAPAISGQESLPPGHPPVAGQGQAASAGPAAAGMHWNAPEGWVEETPTSQMRRAQYRLPAAAGDREDGECVVYYFGAGQGGDMRANIERWAGQFSGPGSQPARTSEIKVGDLAVSKVEVGGTYTPSPMSMMGGTAPQPKPGYLLLGAIVPGPDANWFFKCTGPEKTMKAHRERFDALVSSIHVAH